MLTLPSWFPEIDATARIWPLFDADVASPRREYSCRYFTITRLRVRAFAWRSTWAIDFGINLYRRPDHG